MTKHQTGTAIALRLKSAERAVDTAMLEAMALARTMLESRSEMGLAAETGNDELASVVASLAALSTARTQVVLTHKGLAVLARDLRIAWRMEGPLERKMEPSGHLSVVQDAA